MYLRIHQDNPGHYLIGAAIVFPLFSFQRALLFDEIKRAGDLGS